MSTLYEKLKEYSHCDYYGFHMPGHKRSPQFAECGLPYNLDITEIDGFDDLHHAEGILKEAQEQAAAVYHGDETHFLVNGSTVGILSAILGTTEKNDTILVARNCHKSVYHGIQMQELKPVYLSPEFDCKTGLNGEVSAEDVRKELERNPKIRAVMIVSPTYDGVVSDVEAIAREAHKKGVPLIVDEAHGAHFGFHSYFPKNSNQSGADIVIHSLHKTLPSLTQTALLHMNGGLADRRRVREYLHMLQSSSPSYILMASIDNCVNMLKEQKTELFEDYVKRLEKLRSDLKHLKVLRIVKTEHYDNSKIVISTKDAGISGKKLQEIFLREYHLQMEMAAGAYVLAMTSVADTEEGFARLKCALTEIDDRLAENYENLQSPAVDIEQKGIIPDGKLPRPDQIYTCAQAKRLTGGRVASLPLQESAGYIALEYAYLYPPGIPFIVPGERITKEVTEILLAYRNLGYSVEGPESEECIEVWNDG